IERGQFTDLFLEHFLDVIATKLSEIVEADETVRFNGRDFLLDKLEERRPEQISDGAGARRSHLMTNLAFGFGIVRHQRRMNPNRWRLSTSVLQRGSALLS